MYRYIHIIIVIIIFGVARAPGTKGARGKERASAAFQTFCVVLSKAAQASCSKEPVLFDSFRFQTFRNLIGSVRFGFLFLHEVV